MLIKERDTSCTQISLPALTGIPFPKVLHRSETVGQVKSHSFKSFSKAFFIREFGIDQDLKCMYHFKQVPLPLSRGKKSIFARQILAQRVKEGTVSLAAGMHPATFQKNDSRMETDQRHSTDDRELACLNVSFVFIKVPLMLLVLLLLFCLQLLPQGHGWCLDRGFWALIAQKRPRGSTERTRPSSRGCLSLRFYRSRRSYYLSLVGYFVKAFLVTWWFYWPI